MKKIKIYIIHGYTASADSNWFSYLKEKLENDTIEVSILDMPNSHTPQLTEWISHMEYSIKEYDENTIFIGHSLGCVTILNFLSNHIQKKIKGLFLVSGFIEDSPIPELLEFVQPPLNYNELIKLTSNRVVISAKDDDVIHYRYSEILAVKLHAEFILLDKGKHFIDRDNFTKFPLLLQYIKQILE